MSLRMPISKRKIQKHFQYSLWKYALVIVASILIWNLLFTVTRYRTPEDLKIEFYAEGYAGQEVYGGMDNLMALIHSQAMPEMEEVTYSILTLDETYGEMQLMVWISAAQGDIYLLSEERFQRLANGEAMLNLAPYIDSGELDVEGLQLRSFTLQTEEGPAGQVFGTWGIRADDLPGLESLGLFARGGVLSVLAACGNEEYAIRFLNELLTRTRAE